LNYPYNIYLFKIKIKNKNYKLLKKKKTHPHTYTVADAWLPQFGSQKDQLLFSEVKSKQGATETQPKNLPIRPWQKNRKFSTHAQLVLNQNTKENQTITN
jgi:hypothetical protein